MKSKFLTASLLATALFAGLSSAPALAQGNYTPGIDQAQQNISARIQQGLQSGQITPSEAQILYRRDRDIQVRESQFKANGSATQQERQVLRTELSNLSADVERMINNNNNVNTNAARTPGIDNRQENISQRIDEGVRSGRINQREARRLHLRERAIAQHEASYKSDGVVTGQERRQLQQELSALNRDLERMLNNGGRRG